MRLKILAAVVLALFVEVTVLLIIGGWWLEQH
jgi:hypothetical protein